MCGLSGIINAGSFNSFSGAREFYKGYTNTSNSFTEEDILDMLLYLGVLRGPHSTGVFCTDYDDKKNIMPATVYKRVMPATDFLNDPLYKKLKYSFVNEKRSIIGHTRFATLGGVSIETAHPFQENGITLVHNGTLNSWRDLIKGNCVSDSHAITKLLAYSDNNWEDDLEKLDGAYALIWHDESDGNIYIARNSERTLFYCRYHDTYVISSEREMLEFAILRAMQISRTGNLFSEFEIDEFKVGTLYGITPGQKDFTSKSQFTPYVKKATVHTFPRQNNISYTSKFEEEDKKAIELAKTKYELNKGDTIWFTPRDYEIYNGNYFKYSGELRGRLVLEDGKEAEDVLIRHYNLPEVAQFKECDICLGKVLTIQAPFEKDKVKGFDIQVTLDREFGVKGYTYEEQELDDENGNTTICQIPIEVINSTELKVH